MKKLGLYLILGMLLVSSAYASVDYFSERMNFPPGESRLHKQTLSSDKAIEINATIPAGFSLSSTDCTQAGTKVNCVLTANSSRYYALNSPSNCTEGTIYKSYLTSNASFSGDFTFVCISDNKITDCKVEYGHGDADYLPSNQPFVSNEPATLFNLLRVWNIGQYLTPDEVARNATMQCAYENYPVRTYGRVEIDYGVNEINGTFGWDKIEGGYWFRIGVVSQDVSGKSVGDFYTVNCSNLTYQFNHERVVAKPSVCNLEIRNKEPFNCSIYSHPNFLNKAILSITNEEKYTAYDISFDRLVNSIKHTETYQKLDGGGTISYIIDNTTNYTTTIFYIPSWQINSWNPIYYSQQLSCAVTAANNPPYLIQNIPDQSWLMNTNKTKAFDLDNYFGDLDGDNLTYNHTSVSNITVFIDANNSVSFIPDYNFSGTRHIIFNATDGINKTVSNNITLHIYYCGDGNCDAAESCSLCPVDCGTCPATPPSGGGGGGGGGGGVFIPLPVEKEVEETAKPSIEKVKKINLTLISYPENISLKDDKFVVFAEVKNTGGLLLENVELEAKNEKGWSGETTKIGNLEVGEKKIVEIKFKNEICFADYFVVNSSLGITLTARETSEKGVLDVKDINLKVNIPKLSVFTNKKWYSEGGIMRTCIIFNNLGREAEKQLEFGFDISYGNKSYYLVDYLSPFSVDKNKLLVLIKDYVLNDIPVTSNYQIKVEVYKRGDLFTDKYSIAKTGRQVFLNGIIEDKIWLGENTFYKFKYDNQPHSIKIDEVNENFVVVNVYSSAQEFKINLLETEYVDLDKDGTKDISLTYLGIEDNKADIRIKILPEENKKLIEGVESYEVELGERTPELRKPEAITKRTFYDKFKSFVVLGSFQLIFIAILIFIVILIIKLIYHLSEKQGWRNKFIKKFIKIKKRIIKKR